MALAVPAILSLGITIQRPGKSQYTVLVLYCTLLDSVRIAD